MVTELTVGLVIIAVSLGFLAGTFLAQRLLAAEHAKLRTELAAVKALRIRLRGRG